MFVRPNTYESGRTHVIVYNWTRRETVGVDLSAVLEAGDPYELIDVQNLLAGPVVSGTYRRLPLRVPMDLTETAQSVTNQRFKHTPSEFAAFLLRKAE